MIEKSMLYPLSITTDANGNGVGSYATNPVSYSRLGDIVMDVAGQNFSLSIDSKIIFENINSKLICAEYIRGAINAGINGQSAGLDYYIPPLTTIQLIVNGALPNRVVQLVFLHYDLVDEVTNG